jgi:hypothetical protein
MHTVPRTLAFVRRSLSICHDTNTQNVLEWAVWRIYYAMLFMLMGWHYVSELRPPTGLRLSPNEIWVWRDEWYWWNDIDRGTPKNSEKNLSQCHFDHHKSHMAWPGREPGLHSERAVTNRPSRDTARAGIYPVIRVWRCLAMMRYIGSNCSFGLCPSSRC